MALKVKSNMKSHAERNGVAPRLPGLQIMTLPEAAAWLRVSETELLRELESGRIPAKKVAGSWRLVKEQIADWFGKPERMTTAAYKEGLLQLAGVWEDDPSVDEIMKEISRQRKRLNTPRSV